MSTTAYLTQECAAELSHRSYDTIRRYRRKGQLPNSELRDGKWHVQIADLVVAGLLDPLAADDAADHAGRSRAARDLIDTRHELALARQRIEALEQRLADCAGQISFLRSLVGQEEAA